LDRLKREFNTPEALDVAALAPFRKAVEHARKHLERRSAYFDNDIVKFISELHPKTGTFLYGENHEARAEWLAETLARLMKAFREEHLLQHALRELEGFYRRDPKAELTFERFWGPQSKPGGMKALHPFVQALIPILVTEASVERSFQLEKRTWTKEAARMSHRTAAMWLSISWNYPKLFRKPVVKGSALRYEDVSELEWDERIKAILQGRVHSDLPQKRETRGAAQRKRGAEETGFRSGLRIRVLYDMSGKGKKVTTQWFEGKVDRRLKDHHERPSGDATLGMTGPWTEEEKSCERWRVIFYAVGSLPLRDLTVFPNHGYGWLKWEALEEDSMSQPQGN